MDNGTMLAPDVAGLAATPPRPRAAPRREAALRNMRLAMRVSLSFGVLMLIGKMTAYFMTGSTAILSDAAESVIHVIAVAFAAFSLRLSTKPAAPDFPYGYERISFFSAGFEGTTIVLAAIFILYTAIAKWIAGLQLENLGTGTLLVLAAGVLNAGLGWYLIRTGRRSQSLILEANGKHVLTDSLTSFGVVAGLALVMLTKWKPFDPLLAIAVAINILWTGGHLVWRSAVGLLDHSEPRIGKEIRSKLDAICNDLGLQYHGVRYRATGYRQIIEVHLLFPQAMPVGEAHRLATQMEERLSQELSVPADVFTHLESVEDHEAVHTKEHYTGKPE